MVDINTKHVNAKSLPKEGHGGSMCVCPDCTADREKFMVPSELLRRRLKRQYEEEYNSINEINGIKLKPCPFCGCEIINGDETDHDKDCFFNMMKTEIPQKYSIQEIQDAWNKRLIAEFFCPDCCVKLSPEDKKCSKCGLVFDE